MAFQKGGYNDLLEFDIERGVVKYGSYEMFFKDLGIEPTLEVVPRAGTYQTITGRKAITKLGGRDKDQGVLLNSLNGGEDNDFNVYKYVIPKDIELVNRIGEAAQGLRVTKDASLNKEINQNKADRKQGAGSTRLLKGSATTSTASRALLSA